MSVADHTRRRAPGAAAVTIQPRPSPADQLDRLIPRVDELLRRARLVPIHPREYDDLEEEAQRIASALVGAFRGARPVNPPLRVTRNGGLW